MDTSLSVWYSVLPSYSRIEIPTAVLASCRITLRSSSRSVASALAGNYVRVPPCDIYETTRTQTSWICISAWNATKNRVALQGRKHLRHTPSIHTDLCSSSAILCSSTVIKFCRAALSFLTSLSTCCRRESLCSFSRVFFLKTFNCFCSKRVCEVFAANFSSALPTIFNQITK